MADQTLFVVPHTNNSCVHNTTHASHYLIQCPPPSLSPKKRVRWHAGYDRRPVDTNVNRRNTCSLDWIHWSPTVLPRFSQLSSLSLSLSLSVYSCCGGPVVVVYIPLQALTVCTPLHRKSGTRGLGEMNDGGVVLCCVRVSSSPAPDPRRENLRNGSVVCCTNTRDLLLVS